MTIESSYSMAELYVILSEGNTIHLEFNNYGEADIFRTKLATYKSRTEKYLKEIGALTPLVLSMEYSKSNDTASFKFNAEKRSNTKVSYTICAITPPPASAP